MIMAMLQVQWVSTEPKQIIVHLIPSILSKPVVLSLFPQKDKVSPNSSLRRHHPWIAFYTLTDQNLQRICVSKFAQNWSNINYWTALKHIPAKGRIMAPHQAQILKEVCKWSQQIRMWLCLERGGFMEATRLQSLSSPSVVSSIKEGQIRDP